MVSRTYRFNNSSVLLKFGNILLSNSEVIVSSADSYLSMGGGLSKAILKAAGQSIYDNSRKHVPAKIGDVVVTDSGLLPNQKYLFHCISIDASFIVSNGYSIELQEYILHHSVDKCFRLMQAMDITSIAFPSIGGGFAGISVERVAKVMSDAIAFNLSQTNKPIYVEIYLFDRFEQMKEIDYLPMFESFAIRSAMCQQSDLYSIHDCQTNSIDSEKKMQHSIFISYSRKEESSAASICQLLDLKGYQYWIDKEGLYSGENFKELLVSAIESAKVIVFLSSANSNASQYCIKELSYAIKMQKKVIPVMLDDTPFAKRISFDLIDIEAIDFQTLLNDDGKKLFVSIDFLLKE